MPKQLDLRNVSVDDLLKTGLTTHSNAAADRRMGRRWHHEAPSQGDRSATRESARVVRT